MTDMRGHNSRMNAGNWIAVSRDMRDHPIVGMGQPVRPADPKRGAYSKYEAWQDLIMEAKYRPFEVMNKGKIVTLQRGQLMAARAWLADRWNWSEKTVRVFISRLEGEFMVRSETVQQKGQYKGQQKTNTITVLNICNYDIYQTILELMQMEKGQQNGQQQGQPRASQGPDNNKETSKQEKGSPDGLLCNGALHDLQSETKRKASSIPDEYTTDFEEFWKIYPRRKGKVAAFRVWRKLSLAQKRRAYVALKKQLPALNAMIRGPNENFCPHPSTWLNEGRFDDEPEQRSTTSALDRDIPDFMPRPREDVDV